MIELEPDMTAPGPAQPYRGRGIGTKALQHVLDAASKLSKPRASHIYLHVQVSRESAKKFYERHGFQTLDLFKDYYKKIEPRDAWIMERELERAD